MALHPCRIITGMDHRPSSLHDHEAELDALFDRLSQITLGETRAMVAAWNAADAAERTAAWGAVRREVRASGRQKALDEAREALLRWSNDFAHGLPAATYSFSYNDETDRLETRIAALPPILDAAAATIVRDRLPDEQFQALHGPWALVTSEEDDDDLMEDPARDGIGHGEGTG